MARWGIQHTNIQQVTWDSELHIKQYKYFRCKYVPRKNTIRCDILFILRFITYQIKPSIWGKFSAPPPPPPPPPWGDYRPSPSEFALNIFYKLTSLIHQSIRNSSYDRHQKQINTPHIFGVIPYGSFHQCKRHFADSVVNRPSINSLVMFMQVSDSASWVCTESWRMGIVSVFFIENDAG